MRWGVTIAGILVPSAVCAATVLHVDDDAPAGGDGQSWETAYRHLQDALAFAADPANGVTEVRVAQGTYLPDRSVAHPIGTGDRAATFSLIDNVALRGGYAGTGAADPDARDPALYETILSGDLAGDDASIPPESCCDLHDTPGCSDPGCQSAVCASSPVCCAGSWDAYCVALADLNCTVSCVELDGNSHHVVTSTGNTATAILDGFTITAGNADGAAQNRGGGVFVSTLGPSVTDCLFLRNRAEEGAGVGLTEGSPSIDRCAFRENAAILGGGLVVSSGNASAVVSESEFAANGALNGGACAGVSGSILYSDCTFEGNRASFGGAIYHLLGSELVTRCDFVANFARTSGGAIQASSLELDVARCTFIGNSVTGFGGGAVHVLGSSSGTIVNSLFVGNGGATRGGAVSIAGVSEAGMQVANCTMVSNWAVESGAGAHINDQPIAISNGIVWANAAAAGVEAAQVSVGPSGALALNYSCVQGLSGALGGFGNTGEDPAFADIDGADDVAGNGDDDLHLSAGSSCANSGSGVAGVDLGPTDVEGAPRVQACHVDMGAFESPYFVSDCNGNGEPDECDVAGGTSTDCNGNGRLDECDILVGLSDDCNANGFPDECDVEAALYRVDDGTHEQIIQGAGGDLIWFNQFTAQRDGEVIVGVDLCWGLVPAGAPTDVAIWTDPTNDGYPGDARLVALVEDVPAANPQADIFTTIAVPPTPVGNTGDVFYAGAHFADASNEGPASLDQTPPSHQRSWGVVGNNLQQLWNNVVPPTLIDEAGYPGNWMIRARRAGSADCNANAIPDECDGFADLDGDGTVDISDFAILLAAWGACQEACCVADLDGDGLVNVTDFLALLLNWG